MEMSIIMNAKKIAENDNETTSMFDEYTKNIEEERATLNEEFSNKLNEDTTAFKTENRELKEKLEELRQSMEEEVASLREEFSVKLKEETNSLKKENRRLKEKLQEMRDECLENIFTMRVWMGLDWKVCV